MAYDQPLLVLDIETIPDARFHHSDEFPKLLHHQVIAVAWLSASYIADGDTSRFEIDGANCCGEVGSSEKELISELFDFIEGVQPRLVTFNGRGFDLPVLRYRALQYGISAPWYSKGATKWENYDQRFRPEWHCDLMDVLSGYGASKAAKLGEMCDLLGIPCKSEFDGSDVMGRYRAGQIQEIRDYAVSDVMATHALFLKYALFRGEISPEGYAKSVKSLADLTVS
jgi:predicted PolB exonuclease-like 3'-5' exonuclease